MDEKSTSTQDQAQKWHSDVNKQRKKVSNLRRDIERAERDLCGLLDQSFQHVDCVKLLALVRLYADENQMSHLESITHLHAKPCLRIVKRTTEYDRQMCLSLYVDWLEEGPMPTTSVDKDQYSQNRRVSYGKDISTQEQMWHVQRRAVETDSRPTRAFADVMNTIWKKASDKELGDVQPEWPQIRKRDVCVCCAAKSSEMSN